MGPSLLHVVFACGLVAFGSLGGSAAGASRRPPPSHAPSAAQDGVEVALRHYFRGHATGDPSHFRKAFLPSAHIEGVRDGRFTSWTIDEYSSLFKGRPAADEATRVRTIDVIVVSGDAAMAKATLDHGATVFTDFFVLLKVDDEWRIANKVYSAQRKGGDAAAPR